MKKDIYFPNDEDFLIDLALQRTGPLINGGGVNEFKNWVTSGDRTGISNFLKNDDSLRRFLKSVCLEIQKELENLIKEAPEIDTRNIVSIGPGNGILELALLQSNPASKILLIDIETTKSHHHGFFSKAAGYANLLATKNFFLENGITDDRIFLCNPTKTSLPDFRFSLAISTLSMGFHYPCDEYAQFLIKNKEKNAHLVFDKRKQTQDSGLIKILQHYEIKKTIESSKSDRMFLSEKII
jgi:hypothetical protein